jgi:RasGEF domain.
MNIPLSSVVSSSGLMAGGCPSSSQLARALAGLEWEKYQRISPAEYMHAGGIPVYCPNLSAVIALNQQIGDWIRLCIVDESLGEGKDGVKKRSEMKQYFVETGKECQKLGNFQSLGAILRALQSEAVDRLSSTHEGMSPVARRTYQSLVNLLKPESHYAKYKRVLSRVGREGCIPYHGALSFVEHKAWIHEPATCRGRPP